jgi:hypothetical protein
MHCPGQKKLIWTYTISSGWLSLRDVDEVNLVAFIRINSIVVIILVFLRVITLRIIIV